MSVYYVAGVPCSDELYHFGIPGMRWGVRRFQNADRTWTAAGKIRYGSAKTAKAVGSGLKKVGKPVGKLAKKAGKGIVRSIKRRHPWMIDDDEMEKELKRIGLEQRLKSARRDLNSDTFRTRLTNTVGEVAKTGAKGFVENVAKNAGNKVGTEIGNRLGETRSQRRAREIEEQTKIYNRIIEQNKARDALNSRDPDKERARIKVRDDTEKYNDLAKRERAKDSYLEAVKEAKQNRVKDYISSVGSDSISSTKSSSGKSSKKKGKNWVDSNDDLLSVFVTDPDGNILNFEDL